MSEMVERVAAVMRASYLENINPHWVGVARAVITVMREPTEEICRAVFDAANRPPNTRFGDIWTASDVWQAGIDAALKE